MRVMKSIITSIFVYSMFLVSCDPTFCYNYTIENKTYKNIELIKFSSDSIGIKKIVTVIFSNDFYTEIDKCGSRKGGIVYGEDSIQVKANGTLVKTYYPNDKGKSIFNTNPFLHGKGAIYSWKLVKDNKRDIKYVFEITEDDLK